jgi:hypothetical protein
MLYMFSSPDFLYATSLFTNTATYVLAGLEPVGPIPDLIGPQGPNYSRGGSTVLFDQQQAATGLT